MGYREVRIYEGEFPTLEQILTGDPARPPFPREVWRQEVKPGEFAVRYKDFKTGLARNADGKHVQFSEVCRIFGDLEEARADSREIARANWTVVCIVYDHTGAEVARISNSKELNKYAAHVYAGMFLWTGLYACVGMSVLWLVYRMALLVARLWRPGFEPIRSLSWIGWLSLAAAGLMIAIAGWLSRLRHLAVKRVGKIKSSITPEEMKRFEETNTLYGTADLAERERFLKLYKELQLRVQEALKK
jgi:hypothetical protein